MDSPPTFVRTTDGCWLNLAYVRSVEPVSSWTQVSLIDGSEWTTWETPDEFFDRIKATVEA